MPFDWARAYGEDEFGLWQAFEVGGVRQVLRWIPPGRFLMGSPETEPERGSDEIQHEVVLTKGHWLADTACTQAIWRAVTGKNPSQFSEDEQNPVENVSWNDISFRFLPALNRLVPGLNAVLPTEAQWEYACRAGTQTPFWFGSRVDPRRVNYSGYYPYSNGARGEDRQRTVPVKTLPANAWGLYELHGNVQEWCTDGQRRYESGVAIDPVGPRFEGVAGRVLRGGGWYRRGGHCRSASREADHPDVRLGYFGFRIARLAE
jgi:formylglycine-generating enzyme required for sulfatase activity